MKRSKFTIWKNTDCSRWHWNLKAANGEIVCSGQPIGYSTRYSARKGIRAVRRAALIARVEDD